MASQLSCPHALGKSAAAMPNHAALADGVVGMVWVYWIVGIVAALGALLLGLDAYTRWVRRKILMAKYNDEAAVDRIMRHVIWQGMTAPQVVDALGEPELIEPKVMKTKTVETWKYGQKTRTRFKWRITLEDGVVTGWEEK
jgi:hypothetical protein